MKAFPRDVEIKDMTVRHIGVESELHVESAFQEVSLELNTKLCERGLLQNVGYDGGGREFRTNPISIKSLYQVRGKRYLMEYFNTLKQNTVPINSGGTHIHISILNKDHENMESNAVALGMAFFHQFQKIAGRETHWAGKFGSSELTTIERVREYINEARTSENERVYYLRGSILNPTGHQTLEFRGPKGSNDAEEILAWVDFLEAVVKTANRKSVSGIKFSDLLKGERISAYVKKLDGHRKLTKDELSQKLNVMALA